MYRGCPLPVVCRNVGRRSRRAERLTRGTSCHGGTLSRRSRQQPATLRIAATDCIIGGRNCVERRKEGRRQERAKYNPQARTAQGIDYCRRAHHILYPVCLACSRMLWDRQTAAIPSSSRHRRSPSSSPASAALATAAGYLSHRPPWPMASEGLSVTAHKSPSSVVSRHTSSSQPRRTRQYVPTYVRMAPSVMATWRRRPPPPSLLHSRGSCPPPDSPSPGPGAAAPPPAASATSSAAAKGSSGACR